MLPALFNPSNDMALAANVRQYFPPQRIQQMEDDLADLSRFWDSGPWGWSLATKQRYHRMGVPADQLPSDEWLAEVRRLSSREFGVAYYQKLTPLLSPHDGGRNPLLPSQVQYIKSIPQELFLSPLWGSRRGLIIKAPWSSSGRGNIIIGKEIADHATLQHIERIIREQGGIVVEPYYDNKALDFATEFEVTDDGTEFVGYSVFYADETGHYGGNLVKSQAELLSIIDLPQPLLDELIAFHRRELGKLAYRGPVGIDMMRLRDGRVHPCVEVNFRMTMGLLAILLHRQGITDDQLLAGHPDQGFSASIKQGILVIDYKPLSKKQLQEELNKRK